ncbi:hypothetical protein Afil01_23690 [Actinorhabdospora filicis]|uniref:Phosphatidic acid phosphatase type 2/haloperoxidase domain-containing protein n=1 Tax=Actinorhabdospora filicis TaxID=1785913 RepID=A0A9W6SKE4_9ACTN|nr:phosphatase PAP2 family protein [Actinorhabdospora filicis]GLZ77562.1 hypothetical protein Afil01_23690 [Actinorhabdospora filicis]
MLWSAVAAVVLVAFAYGLVRLSRPLAARIRPPGWISVEVVVLAAGAAVIVASFSLFLGILDAVTEGDDIAVLDEPVVAWLAARRRPVLDAAEIAATNLGGAIALVAGLGGVTVYVCRRTRSWRPFWLALAGLGGVQVLVNVIKLVIGRQRPAIAEHLVTATGYSFPSGHSASSVVGFGLIAWLLCMVTVNRTLWATAWTAAALGAVAVGASRVYLGVHYPSDVLAGWLLGVAWLGVAAVADRVWPRKGTSLPG